MKNEKKQFDAENSFNEFCTAINLFLTNPDQAQNPLMVLYKNYCDEVPVASPPDIFVNSIDSYVAGIAEEILTSLQEAPDSSNYKLLYSNASERVEQLKTGMPSQNVIQWLNKKTFSKESIIPVLIFCIFSIFRDINNIEDNKRPRDEFIMMLKNYSLFPEAMDQMTTADTIYDLYNTIKVTNCREIEFNLLWCSDLRKITLYWRIVLFVIYSRYFTIDKVMQVELVPLVKYKESLIYENA